MLKQEKKRLFLIYSKEKMFWGFFQLVSFQMLIFIAFLVCVFAIQSCPDKLEKDTCIANL